MDWKNHIYGNDDDIRLLRKLSQQIGILKRIRNYVTPKRFMTLLQGLFYSKLYYGITVWGSVSGIPGQPKGFRTGFPKTDLRRIQSLQNKALRLLHWRDMTTPTRDLLKETNQLSVNQTIAYHILIQTHTIRTTEQPNFHYLRLFSTDEETPKTRSGNMKRVEFRLNIGRSSFFYQANRLWLALPKKIREITSLGSFKKEIKIWTSENIPPKPYRCFQHKFYNFFCL